MAARLVLMSVGLALLMAASCQPQDNADRAPVAEGESLGISVNTPSADRTVPQGTPVQLEWSASNLTADEAFVSLLLESRTDLVTTTLLDRQPMVNTGETNTFTWDTAGYKGPYAVIARIEAGGLSSEHTGAGIITVNAAPTFEFTAPTESTTFLIGNDNKLTIAWAGGDETATAQIGLDLDTTHDGGDEVFIHSATLTDPAGPGSFEWDGKDVGGGQVASGRYFLFAKVSDNVNDVKYVDSPARLTVGKAVTPEPNTPASPEITKPAEDTNYLTTNPSLTIEYKPANTAEVLVDLKLDTDDNHGNGNELTILSQQFVEPNQPPPAFTWTGQTAGGATVDPGVYKLLMVVSTGSGTPAATEGKGLILVRTTEQQPLVALLEPATARTVNAGEYVNIRWRDPNDPNDPNDPADPNAANIKLEIDSSRDPNAPSADRAVILATRAAKPDGVQDTFAWQVPFTLAPKSYWIIATTARGALSSVSVSPAAITVRDPNSTK
jgi:flagellar hook assembly protein FlgD